MKKKNVTLTERSQAFSAVKAAADPDTPSQESEPAKKIKGIGIRLPEDVHEALKDISHELHMSLNTLLVEGAEAMQAKYYSAAMTARKERDNRKK